VHVISPADPADPSVQALIEALTAELAGAGYTADETFGYTPAQLAASPVHLLGVRVEDTLVGIGGVEVQAGGFAELKRMYVAPEHRGTGAADDLMARLLDHAGSNGVTTVRLETGDKQAAAIAYYQRHGFTVVPRFGPYVDSATSVCMQRSI
jgi:putative acetyltransferase